MSEYKGITKMSNTSQEQFITRPASGDILASKATKKINISHHKSSKKFKFIPKVAIGHTAPQKKQEVNKVNNFFSNTGELNNSIVRTNKKTSMTNMLSKQNFILQKSDMSKNFKNHERNNTSIGVRVRLEKLLSKPYLTKINTVYIMSPNYMKKISELMKK